MLNGRNVKSENFDATESHDLVRAKQRTNDIDPARERYYYHIKLLYGDASES